MMTSWSSQEIAHKAIREWHAYDNHDDETTDEERHECCCTQAKTEDHRPERQDKPWNTQKIGNFSDYTDLKGSLSKERLM